MKKDDSTKKLLTLRDKGLIERITNDEVSAVGGTSSTVIERHILASMLPHNRSAAALVRLLYSNAPPDIGRAFDAIFSTLAAGVGGNAAQSNGLPLVKLFHTLCADANAPTGEEQDWPYILQQWDSLAELLERTSEKEPEHADMLHQESEYLRDMENLIKENPANVRFVSLVGPLLTNWPLFANYTRTYRLLAAIARTQNGMRNDAEARYNLVEILREVSKEWTE